MNSKDRVRAAIAREEHDRIPLGFYAVDYDTVGAVIGRASIVRNKVEIKKMLWAGRRDELAERLKTEIVEFYKKIDCADIILPKEAMVLPPSDYDPDPPKPAGENLWEYPDGRVFQAVPEVNEIQCIKDPRPREKPTVEMYDTPADTTPPDPSCYEVIDHVIEAFGDTRYVASPSPGIVAMSRPGGTETGLMLYALEPEVIHAFNRRMTDGQNAQDEAIIRRQCPGVLVEQDMAGTNGPMISPDMFHEMCLPYLIERIEHIKTLADQVILHNCGNNLVLMDMFAEAGIDCYQSLQTTAGMEVGKLLDNWGDRLSFWGGVAIETLIQGTPADVRREVQHVVERVDGRPGFILGPSHSIAKGVPYDNFMALLDTHSQLADRT